MSAPTRPRWLRDVNGEVLAVPGLSIWGNRLGDVFAVIAQDERGATELWHDEIRNAGGIELHSPRDWGRFSTMQPCAILGGPCWGDGSLTVWQREFAQPVAAGDSVTVLRRLVAWHREHFGGDS